MRMSNINREFYIKKGAMKISPKDLPVVFYVYENDGVSYAQCFVGRAKKPTWHYRFKSKERMEQRIKDQIESVKASEERKAKEREQRKQPHTLKVGDILVSSWGYDQTNVSFYQVTALIGKTMVEYCSIGSDTVEESEYSHGMADTVTANPDRKGVDRWRAKANHTNSIRISSCEYAYPWDGSSMYRSWYA
jgi:hypothetical protein